MAITEDDIRQAAQRYGRELAETRERLREERDEVFRRAYAEGWKQVDIAYITGLSREAIRHAIDPAAREAARKAVAERRAAAKQPAKKVTKKAPRRATTRRT